MRNGGAIAGFRDPRGHLCRQDGVFLRRIHAGYEPEVLEVLASEAVQALVREGAVVATRQRAPREKAGADGLELEHEAVPFETVPVEWPAGMLATAGAHTLDVADRLLPSGFGLQDATPSNIQFVGTRPCLVDFLSIEKRRKTDPVWRAAAQLDRTFTLPLLARRLNPVTWRWTLGPRGISPEELSASLGWLERMRPLVFWTATMPRWLAASANRRGAVLYAKQIEVPEEEALAVVAALFRRQRRRLLALADPPRHRSPWQGYQSHDGTRGALKSAKLDIVSSVLRNRAYTQAMDLGCNQGDFSAVAARHGATVVAIDADETIVDGLWTRATRERLPIVPLVVDLARPAGPLGWHAEIPSFVDRAHDRFDLVLALAIIHHLMVTERIPLDYLADFIGRTTRRTAIVEYVPPGDPMSTLLLRGNDPRPFAHLTLDRFLDAFAGHFSVTQTITLEGTGRVLAMLERKAP